MIRSKHLFERYENKTWRFAFLVSEYGLEGNNGGVDPSHCGTLP